MAVLALIHLITRLTGTNNYMDLYEQFLSWRLTVMPFVPIRLTFNILKVGYCVAAMLTNLNAESPALL